MPLATCTGACIAFVAQLVALPQPYVLDSERADRIEREGAEIWDEAGRSYLDAPRAPKGGHWQGWPQRDIASLIAAMMWHESGRFARAPWAGTARGDHGRSVCDGQINTTAWHAPGFRALWDAQTDREPWASVRYPDALLGAEGEGSCIRAVRVVLELWVGKREPGDWAVASILTGYGTGKHATPQPWVWARVGTWRALRV